MILALDISKHACGAALGDGCSPPSTFVQSFRAETDGATFAAFQRWLTGVIREHRPTLMAMESVLTHTKYAPGQKNRGRSTATMTTMVGLAAIAQCTAALNRIPVQQAYSQTWRKAFLGDGKPDDPKASAIAMCDLLGWPHGGSHDRAEAAGVWAWAHLHHGNARAMVGQLSHASARRLVNKLHHG